MMVSNKPLYLVLDQGSHASRAMLFDHMGHVISAEERAIATQYPQSGMVEHDPEEVLESLREAMRATVAGHRVAAAGLATQRSSIVCWNRNTGRVLSPVISWQDVREAAWMSGFSQYRDDIHARTGLFPSAHYGVSKLHWCLDHLPAVQQALGDGELAWGPLASFLLFRLLTERPLLADPGNASRTLLWNMHARDWDAHLLEMFTLSRQSLPQCVPNRHDFGHLDISGRKIPMQVVMGDLPASLFAAGQPQRDVAYINAGTGAFVQRVMQKEPEDVKHFLTGVAYQDAHTVLYSLEGTVNGAGSALEWFKQENSISCLEEGLPGWLQREGNVPLFLNGVSGLGSPFWNPVFNSRFVGEGEVWQQAVAVVESIVFLLRINLEGMAAYVSVPAAIHIGGGLAQLDGFCQRLANLADIPVVRLAQSEATACGCAFLLAGRPDNWQMPEPDDAFPPRADAGLTGRYVRWKALMESSL
ncbi:MAG: glycerol kinase GlpK [Zetaproteobacteria bacterium]|nr:MAG: glycerol kinase GlpK [Zetaproteobacteria bacterium]